MENEALTDFRHGVPVAVYRQGGADKTSGGKGARGALQTKGNENDDSS